MDTEQDDSGRSVVFQFTFDLGDLEEVYRTENDIPREYAVDPTVAEELIRSAPSSIGQAEQDAPAVAGLLVTRGRGLSTGVTSGLGSWSLSGYSILL